MAKSLLDKITCGLEVHKLWEGRDFAWAQIFVWVGLLSSVASSLLATGIFGKEHSAMHAVIAAVPAAVIVVDKTFKFAARSVWHATYRSQLNLLRRELVYAGADEKEVAAKLSKLEIEMEKNFPALDPIQAGNKGRP